jgi:uncharacterized repeat protein (TIGR03803 family)
MSRKKGFKSACAALLIAAPLAVQLGHAQTYTVLHRFTGNPDGAFPFAPIILDLQGNLYGTTYIGGANGFGAIFVLDHSGEERVLYSFQGGDGVGPQAGLRRDSAGNLYGTVYGGGVTGAPACVPGCGSVIELDSSGKEVAVYVFPGGNSGSNPWAGVVRDSAGNLYGTTYGGGSGTCGGVLGCGVLFKLADGKETVLHNFGRTAQDGVNPSGTLIHDAAGNFYGTAQNGGVAGGGVIFKMDTTAKETVMYAFGTVPGDGTTPYGSLIRDAAGNFYGITNGGGAYGLGTVFSLDAKGKETILYSFTGGADGASPRAGVVRDSAGNLIGTTSAGGSTNEGVVYMLNVAGNETVLHDFTGGADGAYPNAALIRDTKGNLYGTAAYGGVKAGPCSPNGCGVVYRIKP